LLSFVLFEQYLHTYTDALTLHSHYAIPFIRHLQRTIENVNAICGSFYQEQFLEAAEVLDETHNDVSVDELRERMEKGVNASRQQTLQIGTA
jgi:hypothetical protein